MSRALKCDRCKTCFDPDELKDTDIIVCFDEIAVDSKKTRHKVDYTLFKRDQNLCPVCAKLFIKWMGFHEEIPDFYKDASITYPDVVPKKIDTATEHLLAEIDRIRDEWILSMRNLLRGFAENTPPNTEKDGV